MLLQGNRFSIQTLPCIPADWPSLNKLNVHLLQRLSQMRHNNTIELQFLQRSVAQVTSSFKSCFVLTCFLFDISYAECFENKQTPLEKSRRVLLPSVNSTSKHIRKLNEEFKIEAYFPSRSKKQHNSNGSICLMSCVGFFVVRHCKTLLLTTLRMLFLLFLPTSSCTGYMYRSHLITCCSLWTEPLRHHFLLSLIGAISATP